MKRYFTVRLRTIGIARVAKRLLFWGTAGTGVFTHDPWITFAVGMLREGVSEFILLSEGIASSPPDENKPGQPTP